MRRQCRNQHQRARQQFGNALVVGLDAAHAMRLEAGHAVGEQADAVQEIVGDQRFENIQFEIARGAAEVDRHVVAEDLTAEHGQRFALRRIDLARHDRAARLVLRNADFTEAGARPGGQPAHVVGDFHQGCGERFQRAVRGDQRIVRGQRGKFVRRTGEGQAAAARQFGRDARAELGVRVQSGADGGAADRQRVQRRQGGEYDCFGKLQLRDVGGKLLAERQRRGVLQMRAADLDDAGEGQ